MAKATVNEDRCKGCGLCTTVCPRKIMVLDKEKLNKMGYHPAHLCDEVKCTGCAMCAIICPDVAIIVEK
ncbi:MAG: 4Fe-4S binding protein [Clostridia bacterium]|nr:4Fe-4S binding protein [Clostridia bacterium]